MRILIFDSLLILLRSIFLRLTSLDLRQHHPIIPPTPIHNPIIQLSQPTQLLLNLSHTLPQLRTKRAHLCIHCLDLCVIQDRIIRPTASRCLFHASQCYPGLRVISHRQSKLVRRLLSSVQPHVPSLVQQLVQRLDNPLPIHGEMFG
jgi:hypothetical protein